MSLSREKCEIRALLKQNKSKMEIPRLIGISRSAVNRIIKKLLETVLMSTKKDWKKEVHIGTRFKILKAFE